MKWNSYRLQTTTQAEDLVSDMLMTLGIQGVQIEDHMPLSTADKERMFVDILPETGTDDGIAYVTFYMEEDKNPEPLLGQVQDGLKELAWFTDVGSGHIEASQTEDVDWVNNWKQYFHQFTVDDVLIIPSWEQVEPKDKNKMIIHIDPGTAFGTGMHDTTQLCIRQLKKYIQPGSQVLDVGCGSGILGMLALKFGGAYALGTDLDPCAITATRENMEANEIQNDQYTVMIGNLIDEKEAQDAAGYDCYDIALANILAEVLVELTPQIPKHLKKGGIYITSGILNGKEQMVANAYEKAGLTVLEINHQGEWASVTGRK